MHPPRGRSPLPVQPQDFRPAFKRAKHHRDPPVLRHVRRRLVPAPRQVQICHALRRQHTKRIHSLRRSIAHMPITRQRAVATKNSGCSRMNSASSGVIVSCTAPNLFSLPIVCGSVHLQPRSVAPIWASRPFPLSAPAKAEFSPNAGQIEMPILPHNDAFDIAQRRAIRN